MKEPQFTQHPTEIFGYPYVITDAQDLHEARDNDAIHFCTFRTIWNKSSKTWELKFDKRVSTNIEGIRKILGGAHEDKFPTIDEFENNINRRLNSSKQLKQLKGI